VLWVVLNLKQGVVFRLGAVGAVTYRLYLILATGSRGGLVALIVAFLFIIFRSPGRQRLGIIVAGVAGSLCLPAVVSPQTLRRLLTFSANSDVQEAVESQEARRYTVRKSVEFTVTHPIFGIGPGQFPSYEGKTSKEQGMGGAWRETHNSYLEAFTECGILGGLVFMAGAASTLLLLNRIYRQARGDPKFREIAAAALCMMTSMVGFGVAILFFDASLPILPGRHDRPGDRAKFCGAAGISVLRAQARSPGRFSLLAGDEAPRHAQQVSQSVGVDARQPHEHARIVDVMILQVIDFRVGCQQFRPAGEIDANRERVGLGGAVNGNARQQLSANL
jgi:hypothetical protein